MAPTESVCLDSTPRPRCARSTLVDLRPPHSSRNWCLGDRTPLDHRGPHGAWPLCGGGQRRARCGTRIHRTRQHAHQPSAALVTDALARRLTEHHLPAALQRLARAGLAPSPDRAPSSASSLPRCEVLDLRGSGPRRSCCCFQPAAASHTTNTHAHAHTRTHSTPGLTIIAQISHCVHAMPQRRSCSHRYSSYLAARTAFLSFFVRVSHAVPAALRWSRRLRRRSFFLLAQGSRPAPGRPFFLSTCSHCSAAPCPPASKNMLASAHTRRNRRTNEATCGPQAWLTGRLHEGGIRSVRSPLRRAPLLATPIAKPLQCGRP